jgi:hypothetical protein
MTDLMEWFLIFFMFYTFCSFWLISKILDNILKILEEMNSK